MITIRGAITIKENSKEEIQKASVELMNEVIKLNSLDLQNILSIFISCTNDITKDYPGKYIREHFNLSNVSIMHFNEMNVENSLPLCIRILVMADIQSVKKPRFVYLNEAKKLRKDLIEIDQN